MPFQRSRCASSWISGSSCLNRLGFYRFDIQIFESPRVTLKPLMVICNFAEFELPSELQQLTCLFHSASPWVSKPLRIHLSTKLCSPLVIRFMLYWYKRCTIAIFLRRSGNCSLHMANLPKTRVLILLSVEKGYSRKWEEGSGQCGIPEPWVMESDGNVGHLF